MKKSYLMFLLAASCIAGKTSAQTQPCYTDEVHQRLLAQHPEWRQFEADYEKQIQAALKKIDLKKFAKTTDVDTIYDVPVVVHVIHDYNTYVYNTSGDYIQDTLLYNAMANWNIVYAKQNADTSEVITPFKKYIGNPKIRLHWATIDPNGRPTKGITRHRSYLTYNGGDNAKFDDWQPTSYVNIWFINTMSAANGMAAAYAMFPSAAANIPWSDGVIALASYMDHDKTINHEVGHMMNLSHPWGNTNNPGLECGDDNVDDTPPTKGHNPSGCTLAALYDTTCAGNYYKVYTDSAGHMTFVNYPDTTNAQNIMDYTYCSRMFTKGQAQRMHAALQSDVAGRNNLWSPANLAATGALAPYPDLKPIPDFLVSPMSYIGYTNKNANFVFPGQKVKFINWSWNDTVTAVQWNFSNGAAGANGAAKSVSHNKGQDTISFSQPGWATVGMTVTGNNSGDSTVTFNKAVFVADSVGKSAVNYFQEFDAAGDRDKWPSFNYYNNEFKWQYTNVGVWDNSSIMYTGFDSRYNPSTFQFPITGNPGGDFDDMYSEPMDLTNYTGATAYLNFFYAGASRSSSSTEINDSLIIDYSVSKGNWQNLKRFYKGSLNNNGSMPFAFVPTSITNWAPNAIALPANAVTSGYVTFRFRYKPGQGVDGYSSGNNFYMDRISFSNTPASVAAQQMSSIDVAVVPNPTSGNAYVLVKDADNATAHISVMDITGKVVYTASQQISGNKAQIEIPQSVIAVKGMYLVQTVTGNQSNTQKLVVY
jgi:hypothetical protein